MVALVALVLVFFSLPALFAQFTTLCREAAGVCLEQNQLTPEYAQAFREAGIPPRYYAIFMIGVDAFSRLVWFAVGALIFLRRSRDRMALLDLAEELTGVIRKTMQPAHVSFWLAPARGKEGDD